MAEANVEFYDTVFVEHIDSVDFIAECAIHLSMRDETQNDIPKFEGPSHRIDSEQVIENYIEVNEETGDEDVTKYHAAAFFTETDEGFEIVFTITKMNDSRLKVEITTRWETNHHSRDSYPNDVKVMQKTQEAILDGIKSIVGKYNAEFEDDIDGKDTRPGAGA